MPDPEKGFLPVAFTRADCPLASLIAGDAKNKGSIKISCAKSATPESTLKYTVPSNLLYCCSLKGSMPECNTASACPNDRSSSPKEIAYACL